MSKVFFLLHKSFILLLRFWKWTGFCDTHYDVWYVTSQQMLRVNIDAFLYSDGRKVFYFISITKEWNNGIQRGNKCIMHTFQTLWVIFFFLHNKRVRSFDYYIYFLCIRNLFLRYSIKKFIHLNSMFVLRITSMYSILSNFCLNIFSFFLRSSLAIVDLITVLLFESFVRNGTQRSKKLC